MVVFNSIAVLFILLLKLYNHINIYFSVCDPVMGDDKKMYVPKDILDVYKNDIIHLTDILTPNEYELELEKLYLFVKNFKFSCTKYLFLLIF